MNQRTLEVIVLKLADHLRMKIIKCPDCSTAERARELKLLRGFNGLICDTCKGTRVDVVEKPDKL